MAFYVEDLDSEVARILDETLVVLKREGANIVQVELPDQRQLTAACQLVLAVEAAAFHKRWLIERPQDYGPQVLMRLQNGLAIPGVSYLEVMRWRGRIEVPSMPLAGEGGLRNGTRARGHIG